MEIKEVSKGSSLEDAYIHFLNRYRVHPTNSKSFNWQFSYLPEKTVVTGIINNEEVVGSQCMMPIEMSYQNETLLSGKCENSYLDENLRGSDYFTKLFSFSMDLCQDKKIELLWAFTPAIKPYYRLGFNVCENLFIGTRLFIKTPSLKRYFSNRKGISILKEVPSYFITILSSYFVYFTLAYRKIFKHKNRLTINNSMVNKKDMELLNQEIKKNNPSLFLIIQSNDYLNWRAYQNPNKKFSSKYFYEERKLVAYCLYSQKEQSVVLHSLIYSDKKYLNKVLFELMDFFREEKNVSILYRGNYENDLNKQIFLFFKKYNLRKVRKAGLSFVYRFTDNSKREVIKKGDWFINDLWTEGY